MDDKKVTQSITMIGGFLTMLITSLIGFGVLPEAGEESANQVVGGLVQTAQGIAALVTVYGIRRKLGESQG